jgi:hypothetical protein
MIINVKIFVHYGLARGHDKNHKNQKKNLFHKIQSNLTLFVKNKFYFKFFLGLVYVF